MPLTGSGMVGHMASMIYGYAKISTNDQTTSLQKDALEKSRLRPDLHRRGLRREGPSS